MRGTLEKAWELRDYHGAGSVWSSHPVTIKGIEGGIVAFGIQHPKLTPTRLIVYQGDFAEAKKIGEQRGLTVETA